ncbi:MAG TPA: Gfo/Idh/MocA family oxidoreductase [Steroidobacteraceae bacterium]
MACNPNPRSKYRVALVGLGAVAEPHLVAYQALGINIVGVADPRPARRDEIAARYRVSAYPSAEALLREARPDIACILTPANTHRELTELCATAGAHVLCEKPMAVTLEDAHAMVSICERERVAFFYGSSCRYLPALIEARRLIAAGAIGRVRLITEQMIGGRGSDSFSPMSALHYPQGGPGGGGYGLVDHGIHMLDIFPWLCGSTISAIVGRGDRTGAASHPEFAVMSFASGGLGTLLYDGSTFPAELAPDGAYSQARQWLDERGWMGETGQWESAPGTLRVYGSAGSLRIHHYANNLFLTDRNGCREMHTSYGTAPWHFGAQLAAFLDSLIHDKPPPISAADGLRALTALLAVYASERCGQWQTVAPSIAEQAHSPSTVR